MHQVQLLNKEQFVDPFLMEQSGFYLIKSGVSDYFEYRYEHAIEKFTKAIMYITSDFVGVDVPSFEQAKLPQRSPYFFAPHFWINEDVFDQIIENEEFNEESTPLNNDKNICDKIIGACFILTYSDDEEKLKKALRLINKVNDILLTPLSFYIKIKILLRLNKEDEITKDFCPFDSYARSNNHMNFYKFAAIRYIELFINRKENNIGYLISVLSFYLQVPYSSSVLNLLARYQFNDLLKVSFETDINPKFQNILKEEKNAMDYIRFQILLSCLSSNSNFNQNDFTGPGKFLSELINKIDPIKSQYDSLLHLRIFYKLMSEKLEFLYEYHLSEFKKSNPDYDEETNDFEYDEPYTHDDFINDVFEGDESYQWNID